MKKTLILCRRDDREAYDTQATMLRGLAPEASAETTYYGANYEDLLFNYDGTNLTVTDMVSDTDLADYDNIFLIGWFKSKALDDVARATAHYAAAKGVAFANSEAYHGRSFTKLSQCVIAVLNGVPVTPFLFSMDRQQLLEAVARVNRPWPLVVKAVAASRGHNNYLVTGHDQLTDVLLHDIEPDIHYIVEEFVPNDGDFRVLVMGDRVRLVIHRQSQTESHLNNTSQGGKATLVPVPDFSAEIQADCVRLAHLLRREVTGIDMIQNRETGRFYFLEANNMPQLSTGSFVAEKMHCLAEYLNEIATQPPTHSID